MITKTSDAHLQEDPDDVLERSFNFSPEPQWENRSARMQRIVTFMEQRHLALARQYEEVDLAKQITDVNHFHVRLTNMVRDSACPAPRSFIFVCGFLLSLVRICWVQERWTPRARSCSSTIATTTPTAACNRLPT